MVSAISAFYPITTILIASSMTLGLFVGLTIYAIFTKADITMLGGMLFGFSLILLVGILLAFIIASPILTLIIAGAACLLCCVFIIYDT
jgi:FtsH-binding integral membrane protein